MMTIAEMKNNLKKKLLEHCKAVLIKRIEAAKMAMDQAQEAANSEGKSSAGDKYETSRAMGQLDAGMNARQMDEAQRDLAFVSAIDPEMIFDSAQTGSVVETEKFLYFISTGLGNQIVDNQQVIFISPSSPVAKMMEGKKAGESFLMNGQSVKILHVY
jgi:transcription elongation GreA/GreB family factor